jgi:hypothetical protein
MIERTTLTPPLADGSRQSRTGGRSESEASPAKVASWLLHFLILIIAGSVITCVFIWQANAINDLKANTAQLGRAAARFEQENAALMVELAALDSPAVVESEALRRGLTAHNPPAIAVAPIESPDQEVAVAAQSIAQEQLARLPDQVAAWVEDLARQAARPAR